MLGFGANLTGFTFVSFLARNLDNVLIGHFAGSVALGYYDRAYKLLLVPLANVNAPITRITVPLLSRMAGDKPRLREAYLRIISQVTLGDRAWHGGTHSDRRRDRELTFRGRVGTMSCLFSCGSE